MPRKTSADKAIHYRIDFAQPQAHLIDVTLTVPAPLAGQLLSLPVWIPGSYLVREFAKHLQNLRASQAGKSIELKQLDKSTWQAQNQAGKPLTLSYQVYAFDTSVRTAFFSEQRAFFNPTSVCLRVHGFEDGLHTTELIAIKNIAAYAVFTPAKALKTSKKGWGSYQFANYDELADTPFEIAQAWQSSFSVRGVTHRVAVSGASSSFDGARLLADTQKIVQAEMAFWHGAKAKPPFKHYVFLLNTVDDGYGGLEHAHSTALIAARKDLPRQSSRLGNWRAGDGYTTLLGLISHEYFHTWNVKRLRPSELTRYDYTRENYTELLWFFEGFTSYYDDLILRRAGLLDNAAYLKLLAKTINQVLQTPGRLVQSAAQASFDAWIKYYRPDENSANATLSYYTKGALIALCFDLSLRSEGASLDAVMRALWQRTLAGSMTEADFAAELQAQSGRSWAKEIAAWVHGTQDLPIKTLLQKHGVSVLEDDAPLAQRLGLRVASSNGSVHIKTVLRGASAEQAGFCAGDEWLGIEVDAARAKNKAANPAQAWRITQLEDILPYLGAQTRVTAIVSRDKRILKLPLQIGPAPSVWRLAVQDANKVGAWLGA
jgi:predicted metalloprotease with PDZ domain